MARTQISPEAAALVSLHALRASRPDVMPGNDREWQQAQAQVEAQAEPRVSAALEEFEGDIETCRYAGMPALAVAPAIFDASRPPVIFLHGGGYTTCSARSSLTASLPLSIQLQRQIISLDYPLAPGATFAKVVDETASAIDAILTARPGAVLIGDSAGGGLALASTNELLARQLSVPPSVVLISPWTDLTDTGDSRVRLTDSDPILRYEPSLAACARAYARDRTADPKASPIYAGYRSSFPDSFVICGSREILLSDSTRLHLNLLKAGARSRLCVFDGMYHSFTTVTPHVPEAEEARQLIKHFLDSERPIERGAR